MKPSASTGDLVSWGAAPRRPGTAAAPRSRGQRTEEGSTSSVFAPPPLPRPKSALTLRVKKQISEVKSLANLVSGSMRGEAATYEDLTTGRLLLAHDSKLQVKQTAINREQEMREIVDARCRKYNAGRLVSDRKEDALAKMIAELEQLEGINARVERTNKANDLELQRLDQVEEEVKDVMAHLYFKMKETMGRQQPKEVRILKHLLAVGDDPRDIRNGLEEAFTPGPELTTEDEDFLFCEAPALLATIDAVLKAYEQQQGKASITGQAAELMQPEVIEKLRQIKGQIEGNFL